MFIDAICGPDTLEADESANANGLYAFVLTAIHTQYT